jgi:sulfate adenylyltransferase
MTARSLDHPERDLIQPHGGILVSAVYDSPMEESRKREISKLPRLPISAAQVLDVEKIANGTFSPLCGFMGSRDHRSVVQDMRLADGLPFSIPIVLCFEAKPVPDVDLGSSILLWNSTENAPCATMVIEERFEIDLSEQARHVYGTEDRAHPGVDRQWKSGPYALAGPIRLLQTAPSAIPSRYDLSPRDVRSEIRRRGFRTITGFQTRNLAHRAHERLQKLGLELTDGLLIHPLIGWKKRGDMLPEVILDGYEILIEHYYPRERVMLSGLTTAMRYAGPREALFHAIIRKNFGCTHFIVGRDHAGVGNYYDKYAGHRVFDQFTNEELGIIPLRLHGPCYCHRCDEIVTEVTCPHGPEAWLDISGTEVRAMISRGECPTSKVMRPEIGQFLIERAKSGAVFFDEVS